MAMLFKVQRPSGQHVTFRFQRKDTEVEGSGWKTFSNEEIDKLNELYRKGTLSYADANNRATVILEGLYEERDKHTPVPTLAPGNAKILADFLTQTYTPRKLRDMGPTSYATEVSYLQLALVGLGNVAIDGDVNAIQKQIDRVFQNKPRVHKRRTTSINRLRKFLNLPPILHMRVDEEEVVYITEQQVKVMLSKLKEPYRTLAAVAFYTGCRKGEIFGLTRDCWRGSTILVKRQMYADGTFGKTKHRKPPRPAYVIPGGEEWLERLFRMLEPHDEESVGPRHYLQGMLLHKDGTVKRNVAVSKAVQIAAGIRFHDLRHSTAVHLVSKGATLDWVAQSLGHSRETCERYYSGHQLAPDSILSLDRIFRAVKDLFKN